ncbi:MAG: 3-phosphoshikimate 1-carboxyvinyltransferase [Weeksellaceae bacterium]|nr:3-phosphoshikimate 1-carboxyvinyltransferase [Weeksellaceae bacterium]
MILLSHPTKQLQGKITIPGSKSISNRWLILQALYPQILDIHNLSTARDTRIMQAALTQLTDHINIYDAGTAARFLTAYFAQLPGCNIILHGTERMHQRPIEPLVAALQQLGAQINYTEKHGYLPLHIQGKTLSGGQVSVAGNISSQFITALALIGAKMPNGLHILFSTPITSKPYLQLTQAQLSEIGINVSLTDEAFHVEHTPQLSKNHVVTCESDWSSASYLIAAAALAATADLELMHFSRTSTQGDSALLQLITQITNLQINWSAERLHIHKTSQAIPGTKLDFKVDFNHTPDLAQTFAVLCASLRIPFHITGLHTLAYKETHRLEALQQELQKLGAKTHITPDSIELKEYAAVVENPIIETYADHRMAMSFAIHALQQPIYIQEPEVVHKSYPSFWQDLQSLGFTIKHT